MKNLFYLKSSAVMIAAVLLINGCSKEAQFIEEVQSTSDLELKVTASDFDASVPNTYIDFMLSDLIKETPGFTPPVAARSLGYIGVALYESLVPGMPGSNSLVGQLQELESLPTILEDEKYHWPSVANAAMYHIISDLYFNATAENLGLLEGIYTDFESDFSWVPADIYDRSIEFGEAIADAIYEWSTTDGGHEGQLSNFPVDYIAPVGEGLWEPTLPAYSIAMQPYWGSNRCFIAANSTVPLAAPYTYSTNPASTFYEQGYEIYATSLSLTEEQEDIAFFWADGGGTITPPGHSISIAKQILENEDASLNKAALTYAKVGISQADAFICCWKYKYIYNVLRPITYIKDNIDAAWLPLIGTPPFPEYPSGHSTQSGAMVSVMESLFGKDYAFTDHTHEALYGTRSFNSFEEAGWEAAISRLYAGIHYRQACRQGVISGNIIGDNVNALSWN